ncbi:MAG: YebC/PmpR family DNA-binding transcriptional regulator [Kiritimatiellia bacterium]
MSGHSKWATIKHKKGAADAKRGQVFSKLAKELILVAKTGGGNPDTNASLRALITRCKSVSMPNDNIDRAIKKGTGELGGVTMEEIIYEGYASGGVGLIVKVLTDNKNRAASEIRHTFTRHGSDFASQGSVSRNFKRRGQIFVPVAGVDESALMDVVLAAGADDMQLDGDSYEILTDPKALPAVQEAIEKAGIKYDQSEVRMIPDAYAAVAEKSVAKTVLNFVEALEEHDDVQAVYHNMDVSDAVMAELEKE